MHPWSPISPPFPPLPAWLPEAVRLYLDHTEEGLSLRALARREGCHASTVLRHVRRCESRRDDPLVDEALAALGRVQGKTDDPARKDPPPMTALHRDPRTPLAIDEATIAREARRILRRLAERRRCWPSPPIWKRPACCARCPMAAPPAPRCWSGPLPRLSR
ncbi:helix-turn-helix domain-containing protein [Cereibacter changlensis]|uniref:helix-turn-helix domain-containing protein n=1 Tax=Cereibacter changlensis TaxID=402884 RepID=UPI00200A8228|nr:helix-turn-helix domain-containing protein [Cereibacter changlensis]